MIQTPSITIDEICKVDGLKLTRISIIIRDLRTQGRLDRIGSNKNGYWKVNRNYFNNPIDLQFLCIEIFNN